MSARGSQVGGSHYLDMKVQPWDVIDTWSRDERIGYYKGTALAYIMRAGHKGSAAEDILKAQHNLNKLLEEYDD